MNENNLFLPRAAAVLGAGGLAWLAKMAVIAASDGADGGSAETVAAILYLLGAVLMPVGLAAVAVALTSGRPRLVRLATGIAAIPVFFGTYVLVESIAQGAAGDRGPAWLNDEVGILATGMLVAAAGLLLASRAQPRVA